MDSSKTDAMPLPPLAPGAFLAPGVHNAGREGHGTCNTLKAVLGEFYAALPDLPAVEASFLAADAMPQPQRGLLAHFSDMTSTLTRHHGERVTLKLIERREAPQWYRRHIVLETETSRRPVEYGAIRIHLPILTEAARRDVLAARSPLGAIMERHGLNYRHCPGGFFKIRSNRLIEESLGLPGTQWLYGRCNCISDSVGRVVAEVVEILPP